MTDEKRMLWLELKKGMNAIDLENNVKQSFANVIVWDVSLRGVLIEAPVSVSNEELVKKLGCDIYEDYLMGLY